jgi:hypothetical protein
MLEETLASEELTMESAIVRNLKPMFEPVTVVWSNTIPDDAIQFKKGKFGCTLYLFAEAAQRGKVAGGNRESIICNGGRAAPGLGVDFDASDEQLDHCCGRMNHRRNSSNRCWNYRRVYCGSSFR